ncbi:MAG: 16S rRNA (adenine(1518)-N(6)/adenine(1519)-N(6))-dimethyltransferase RsmA [Lachnospiraceae bacterium]|nr:16S rRNA (adenine(1518)-N(6)/adenine(1519)-N(6))-dimethyltransferase RsmA [Lachnospiraceae bacterium]MBR5066360.1 16S rRNA (adenine(1518)-N(6)/adenine(1519)-N(6))-dimethyltransferase RsmA [Lachnospiraceae bacterium]
MSSKAYLGNPSKTSEILNKFGLTAQKRYGQNFLIDSNILEKIVASAGITKEDTVLEIGPGIGTLTQHLAEAAKKVICVEIDKNMIPVLEYTLADFDNVTVINQDILKADIVNILKENGAASAKVVANLPYYITTPIIMELLEKDLPIESITVMIQKEVAERMQTGPGSKDYGALSLAVAFYSNAEVKMTVSPNCFIPRPNVDSAVIRLDKLSNPAVKVNNRSEMFRIIKGAFEQRRKTLTNALSHSSAYKTDKKNIENALLEMGKNVNIRGEELTLEEFARLSDILTQ